MGLLFCSADPMIFAVSTSDIVKSLPGSFFCLPARKKIAVGLSLATRVRVAPRLPCPEIAIRFLHIPDPSSASYCPSMISLAAVQSRTSVNKPFAHRVKVLVLNTRFRFIILTIALFAISLKNQMYPELQPIYLIVTHYLGLIRSSIGC